MKAAKVAFTTLLVAAFPALAATIHVPGDAGTIQAGIDAARAGDSVVVACGTYEEFDIAMKSGVVLTSATGDFSCVTIGFPADDTHDGLLCDQLDGSTVIQGFTIDGAGQNQGQFHVAVSCTASDPVIRNCRITNWGGIGHGIQCVDSSPLVEDCTIEFCGTDYRNGGGIHAVDSSPTIRRCVIRNNVAQGNGSSGGGIHCSGTTSAVIEECTIRDNTAIPQDGPALSYGGGIYCTDGVVVRDCTLTGNRAERGAGIWATSGVTITGCTLESNDAFGGGGIGGGILAAGGTVGVTDCVVVANEGSHGAGLAATGGATLTASRCRITGNAGKFSGGVYASSAVVSLDECTVANNTGTDTGGIAGVHAVSSALSLDQCIVLNECGIRDVKIEVASTLDLSCCDWDPSRLRNNASTLNDLGGNFFADPRFCGPVDCLQAPTASGDYRLQWGSPCLAINTSCVTPPGQIGALWAGHCDGQGGVSVERMSWGQIKAMYR